MHKSNFCWILRHIALVCSGKITRGTDLKSMHLICRGTPHNYNCVISTLCNRSERFFSQEAEIELLYIHVCLMIKLRCLHCNYLHITVIIWKCAKRIIPLSPSARVPTRLLPQRLHADFDIAKRSIDPPHRNASHSDYNEDSRSFKMLMANFT